LDGADGVGHLSAVSRGSISPWRREAVLGWTEREKDRERWVFGMHLYAWGLSFPLVSMERQFSHSRIWL